MTMRRYKEYKDSGVEWLGRVPEHWQVQPIKRLLLSVEQGWSPQCENFPSEAGQWGVLKVGCVNGGRFNADENKALPLDLKPLPELGIRCGDVLVSRANTRDLVGSVALADRDYEHLLLCDKLYRLRVMPDRCEPAFLAHFIGGSAARSVIEAAATGASSSMLNISQGAIVGMSIALPPVDEQRALLRFVDAETAKIDTLIAEQQRLIEVLTEKRQALIAQAVTKGLNPLVPMKDTDIPWLGQVPAHWEVTRLGRFAVVRSGYAFPSGGFSLDESDTRLLRGTNVSAGSIRWGEVVYWKRTPDDGLDDFSLSDGDIVLGMDRPFIGNGTRVARVSESDLPCLLLQRVAAVHPSPGMLAGYLLQLLASELFVHHIGPDTTGVSVPHISPGQICDFRVPIPPVNEQAAVVEFAESVVTRTAELIGEASSAVTLLKERRTALISAAVIGQIDVHDRPSLDTALAETRAEIAAGRCVVESAAAHVARLQAMAGADEQPAPPPAPC